MPSRDEGVVGPANRGDALDGLYVCCFEVCFAAGKFRVETPMAAGKKKHKKKTRREKATGLSCPSKKMCGGSGVRYKCKRARQLEGWSWAPRSAYKLDTQTLKLTHTPCWKKKIDSNSRSWPRRRRTAQLRRRRVEAEDDCEVRSEK